MLDYTLLGQGECCMRKAEGLVISTEGITRHSLRRLLATNA